MYSPAANEGWIGIDDHSKWAVSLPFPGSQRSKKLHLEPQTTLAAVERVTCFSDLNREASQVCTLICCTFTLTVTQAPPEHSMDRLPLQVYRGGGAVCFTGNAALWRAVSGLVVLMGPCHGPFADDIA